MRAAAAKSLGALFFGLQTKAGVETTARLRAILVGGSPEAQRTAAPIVRIGAQLVGPDDEEYPKLLILARELERGEVRREATP